MLYAQGAKGPSPLRRGLFARVATRPRDGSIRGETCLP